MTKFCKRKCFEQEINEVSEETFSLNVQEIFVVDEQMNNHDRLNIDKGIQNEDLEEKINPEGSKWKVVKEYSEIILSDFRRENIKLKNILNDLQKLSIEKSEEIGSKNPIQISRQYLAKFLSQTKFHYLIITLVVIDVIVVFVDLILGLFLQLFLLKETNLFSSTIIKSVFND